MSLLDTLLNRTKSAWQNFNQNTPAAEQYLGSLGHSIYSGASDAVQAVGHAATHPLQTIAAAPHAVAQAAKSTYDLVNGAGAEAAYAAGLGDNNQANRQKFMDVVNSYKEHYGSLSGFTDYLKKHPYAVLGDVAGIAVPALRGASAIASKGILGAADLAEAKGLVPPTEFAEDGSIPKGQRQSLVSPTSEVTPLAKDGLPGNGSVKPMDPKAMAKIMNDPEAAGGAPKGGIIPPEDLGQISMVENEQPAISAQAQANTALGPSEDPAVLAQQAQANEKLAPQPASADVVPFPDNTPTPQYDQLLADHQNGHLTPAEQQEMDASVQTPPSVNNATDRMENVSTDQGPPAPANDPTRLAAIQNFGKNLLSDERGSLGYKGDPPETAESSVTPDMKNRLYEAISDVKPKLGEQRVLNRENLREKVAIGSALRESGADVQTQKAVLEGSPSKVYYQPLKDQFTPEEQASFKEDMNSNQNLSFFDNTMAQDAFDKLTGTHPDGGIPTQSELDALQKAYPQLKGKLGTAGDYLSNFLGIARATKTIGDLGVALRQASPLIGTKEYWKALGGMLGNITSEQRYQSVMDGIRTRPNYDLMKEAGVSFTDLGHDLVAREDFAPSVWAEKIPGVRQSERGFTGFLNQIRADTADRLINTAKDQGINVHDEDFLKQLGDFVNNTTGRGSFGQTFDKAAPLMASVFFSPRLMASRVKLLGIAASAPLEAGKTLVNAFKPGTFETMHPMMQKEYMKSLLGYTAFQTATMGVMKGLGAKIETDPRSADFGRGTFDDTHFDMTGGFQPYVRAAAQVMTLSKKNASGDITPLNDGKTLGATAGSVGLNLLRGKLSPMVGFGLDMALGKDFAGNKVSPKDIYNNVNFKGDINDEQNITNNPAVKLYIPMAAGAMMDAMKEYGAKSPLPYAAGAAEIFGGAAHTYAPQEPKTPGFKSAFGGGFESKFNSGFTSKFGGGF